MGSKGQRSLYIFWAIVIGFLLGVLLRSLLPVGAGFAGLCALLALACAISGYISRSRFTVSLAIAAAFIALGAGIMRMDAAALTGDQKLNALIDTKVVLEGVVSDEPDARESNILVPIQIKSLIIGSTTQVVEAKVLASVLPHTLIEYGDVVRVTGTLRAPEPFETGEGRQFRYPEFLAVHGISYKISNALIATSGENTGNPVKAAAIYLKHFYVGGLQRSLGEPQAGLAAGITVGDKRSIGPELTATFQKVSLVHIIVLSGYNITIVINTLARMSSALPHAANYAISGVVVAFFVLMTGGAASAMRAGCMALIAIYARMSGRVFVASRVLGAFALVAVLWNPFLLAFDPSFQLSVLATLGLIFITPIFFMHLASVPERFGLREIAASTLGTQIAVLPLLLYQNGQFSLVSLPANLLALVPTPFAMFFSFVAAVGGIVAGPLAPVIGFPAYVLLSYVIAVAEILGSLPFAAISVPAFPAALMFAAYGLLILFVIKRKTPPLKAGEDTGRVV